MCRRDRLGSGTRAPVRTSLALSGVGGRRRKERPLTGAGGPVRIGGFAARIRADRRRDGGVHVKPNEEIEAGFRKLPIGEVAAKLGLDPAHILPHGKHIAKIPIRELEARARRRDGHLVLVSAMTPTPAGEGKTTTTIGLGDALARLGARTAICLREPSLGPYFGIKGGGTGAGYAQVVPAEDINLHFVGDMYSVSKANNLLAAMVDNHLQHGNELGIDPRRITWKRVIDLNDRALREIFVGLGGVGNGIPRRDGFDITPASEVMAIVCLARDFPDLQRRLASIVVGYTYKGDPVLCRQIKADGAMTVLLRDAIHPNLVQTLEGTPAFVHCGPFANIAHGCNTAVATRMALKVADYVVTEAGFATDLGAEKFFDIKCRIAKLRPSAAVIVATARSVRWHGGFSDRGGLGNLAKHIENIRAFGIEPVVAINRFPGDAPSDHRKIIRFCANRRATAVVANHYEEGGAGALGLAEAVRATVARTDRKAFRPLYAARLPIKKKIEIIARKMYGARGVEYDRAAETDIELLERLGHGGLPVCIAKTPKSLSDKPGLRGRPAGFDLNVNEVRLLAGAGFVVAICGNIVTMPGLPKSPAAERIRVAPGGEARGLA
ncbi:MAG: formate--tetrahydrofolate ligase [Planctomycetes bacterium]|nr:formate--tetrahydrofolate ligase [Planctomycetota bacterium]